MTKIYSVFTLLIFWFFFISLLLVTRAHCEWWSVQFNRWNANEGKNLFHRRFYKWLILAKNTQSRHVEALPLVYDDIMLYQRQTLIGSSMPTVSVCVRTYATYMLTNGTDWSERNGTARNQTDGLELCVFRFVYISNTLCTVHNAPNWIHQTNVNQHCL